MAIKEKNVCQLGDAEVFITPNSDWIELSLGKKKTRFSKSELWALTFVVMGPKEQDAMMPVRQTEVVVIDRFHRVKLPRDMKKDSTIDVKCHMDVPVAVYDSLKGMIAPGAKVGTDRSPIRTKF